METAAVDIELLLPRAASWVEQSARALAPLGRPLSPDGCFLARRAGVRTLRRVRIVSVAAMPRPLDPVLAEAMRITGFSPAQAAGLTLGFVVLIRRGLEGDRELLAHELRHVAQIERLGVLRFLRVYLGSVARDGYAGAPLELDARARARAVTRF